MPKNTGAQGIGKSAITEVNCTPTLADIGIDARTSSRAQKLAALPEKVIAQVDVY